MNLSFILQSGVGMNNWGSTHPGGWGMSCHVGTQVSWLQIPPLRCFLVIHHR